MKFLVVGNGKKISEELKSKISSLNFDYILIVGDNENLDFFDNLGKKGFIIYSEKKIKNNFVNLLLFKRRKIKIKGYTLVGLSGIKPKQEMLKGKNIQWESNLHLLLKNSKKTIILTHNSPYDDNILKEQILLHKPVISIFRHKEQNKDFLKETLLICPGDLDKKEFLLLEILNEKNINTEFFN